MDHAAVVFDGRVVEWSLCLKMNGIPYDQVEQAYQLCKLQASTDGAFDEGLMRHWFEAAWELCSDMIGWSPPQEIREPICIDDTGNFTISYLPSSEVKIYDGYTLVATLPPSLQKDRCTPALCCLCHPYAQYMTGSGSCQVPAYFIQAVARLFAYMVENRGDTPLDEHVLKQCGALAFLSPGITYVA